MPIVVGAAAALLGFVLVGSVMAALGVRGGVEIIISTVAGVTAGVMVAVWEARRRK
ncbi:hypothetical protein AB0I81_15045 [Nonomuraea sp. NPDC050404]|uniref:hypothetical protein n=1 Tax=Nonomuraea sp. NPDC050404 TaxID=3155783 RepID=UPI0033F2FD93